MNILSAIYAGNKGVLEGFQSHAKNASEWISEQKPESAARMLLDESQVKASIKASKVSDDLLRELSSAVMSKK